MAIETRGFSFSPGESRLAQIVAPPQFEFVSGQSLVGDSGISEWAAGMSNASRMMRENMSSLLAGVTVGVGGITSAIEKLSDRRFQEEQAEKKYERDLEVARIRANMEQELTPEDELDLQLKKLDLRNKQREAAWGEWPEGMEPPPLSDEFGPAIPDPNLDIVPEDVPLEPLPDLAPEQQTASERAALAGITPPVEDEELEAMPAEGMEPALPGKGEPESEKDREENLPQSGRYTMVTFTDGSTAIKDRATGKIVSGTRKMPEKAQGTSEVPEGMVPETVTVTQDGKRVTYKVPEAEKPRVEPKPPEGMRLKGAKATSEGEVSYEYEPDVAEEEVQREIAMAQSAIKQSKRVSDDIDRIIKLSQTSTLPSVGRMSDWVNTIPVDTAASDIRRLISNIQADVAFSALAKMRRESKTGGALGAVSEKELTLLQAAEGSIDPSLSPSIFVANLKRVKEARNELAEMYQQRLEKISTREGASKEAPPSPADNSKEIETQIRELRSSIAQLPKGSKERQDVLSQIQSLTTQYINLTGKTPQYR